MASWREIERSEPEFAERVRQLFAVRKHKTLATLRRDGSPRISGTEVEFGEEDVFLGMMPGSVKEQDVRRDPRVALHSPTVDPPDDDPSAWTGEAKIAGRLVAAEAAPAAEVPGTRFRLDISEVVVTHVGRPADHLVIESWHAGVGLRRRTRA